MKQKHRLEVSQGVVINIQIPAAITGVVAYAVLIMFIDFAVHLFTGVPMARPALVDLIIAMAAVFNLTLGIALGARLVLDGLARARRGDGDADRPQLPPEGQSPID